MKNELKVKVKRQTRKIFLLAAWTKALIVYLCFVN